MIHRIATELVPDIWPLVYEHAVKSMVFHPFMDAEDLLTVILHGQAQLFVVTHEGAFLGFAVGEVLQYPRCRVANVLAAGGHRGFLSVSVKDLFPALEDWAREHNADTFAVHGRPGWMRISKSIAPGSKRLMVGVTWRRLGYERRRRIGSDNAGLGAVVGGSALSN
jgi:hypothetical protein